MKVRVGGNLTDAFEVITGLKQGDALSPMLFNLMLEYVVRKVLEHGDGVELNGTHKVIGYADDLALMGRSAADVRALAGVLESEGRKVGLRVNQDKTEYLHMRRFKTTRTKRNNLIVNGTSYKGVDKFKYLGCTVTDTNQREDEINIRIQNALRCSAALHKVLTSKLISRRTKVRIYKTVIRPILMYGCETWTLTLKEEENLLVAERKILRKILGPVKNEDGIWRIRKNKEIEDIVREPNIIGESKAARLRWLGHVERMEEDRVVKKAYLGQPMGKRPVGRPRYRWTDEVIKDLHALQKPDWKQTAQNREEWRAVVSEAKIHFGSLSQRSK
ncbi:reverse transcriptase (RNA-dependent DNA polymerase) domain-containing protein [Phthorimaea operculella]|nr:reverse transcriptase (RNA-dependent DNA polymerase) domain-containing protein [Phthorimaea operculella]